MISKENKKKNFVKWGKSVWRESQVYRLNKIMIDVEHEWKKKKNSKYQLIFTSKRKKNEANQKANNYGE